MPNGPRLPNWPSYLRSIDQLLELEPTISAQKPAREAVLRFSLIGDTRLRSAPRKVLSSRGRQVDKTLCLVITQKFDQFIIRLHVATNATFQKYVIAIVGAPNIVRRVFLW